MRQLCATDVGTSAAGPFNEDLVALFHHGAVTDIVVLDGASSVADHAYIDHGGSDAAWFVGAFAHALAACARDDLPQRASVMTAVDAVAAQFRSRMAGQSMPLYAYPIAALSWARMRRASDVITLELYCLGDCTTLLRHADGRVDNLDAWINPQEAILGDAIARLARDGVLDPSSRRAQLLPMLRQRREFQNTCAAPAALCLAPRGQFQARHYVLQLRPGAALLVMTDGFYRLVDNYHCHSPASLMQQCIDGGVDSAMRALRQFEATSAAADSRLVKRQDDASAVLCQLAL